MAKKRFLVVEDSFIDMRLIRADEKKIVTIETDPAAGGMTPGTNLIEVDDNGDPIAEAATAAKPKRARKEEAPPAGGGNANDLA